MQEAAERIVNAIRYQLNNGRLEGFNNLIARILHRGCGYHDADYLLLKLRQAALPAELQVPVFQK
jgi:transposase